MRSIPPALGGTDSDETVSEVSDVSDTIISSGLHSLSPKGDIATTQFLSTLSTWAWISGHSCCFSCIGTHTDTNPKEE